MPEPQPDLCPCNPPLVMARSKYCGNCGLLRRDCADPLQRAAQQVGAVVKMAEGLAGQPYARGGGVDNSNLADADVRARAHLRQEPTADFTRHPDVREFPAMMTKMNPAQFKEWIQAPGQLFIVYLPGGKAFPVKVPELHHQFFVAMLTQLRIHLGPDVQAQSAQPVSAPPPPQTTPPAPGAPPPNFTRPQQHLLRHSCPGSGQQCLHPRGRETAPSGAIRSPGRGPCPVCHGDYKLTNRGAVRLHRDPTRKAD